MANFTRNQCKKNDSQCRMFIFNWSPVICRQFLITIFFRTLRFFVKLTSSVSTETVNLEKPFRKIPRSRLLTWVRGNRCRDAWRFLWTCRWTLDWSAYLWRHHRPSGCRTPATNRADQRYIISHARTQQTPNDPERINLFVVKHH